MTEQEWRFIFSDRLHNMLKKRNITQWEFAEKMDLSFVTVSRYMNGERSPKMSTLLRMCDVLGCTLDELVV